MCHKYDVALRKSSPTYTLFSSSSASVPNFVYRSLPELTIYMLFSDVPDVKRMSPPARCTVDNALLAKLCMVDMAISRARSKKGCFSKQENETS